MGLVQPSPGQPPASWRGGLCERTGPSLYGGSHRIEQQDFSKNKKTLRGHFGKLPYSNSSSLISTPPPTQGLCASNSACPQLILEGAETTGTYHWSVPSDWECAHPPGSVCTSSRRELRPQAPGRVQIKEGSVCTHIAWRRPTVKKSR